PCGADSHSAASRLLGTLFGARPAGVPISAFELRSKQALGIYVEDTGNTVKVVILCGGQGTRLREETEFRPKPLVSVGTRPILWHIMKLFSHYGLRDFVLCLGYRGHMIKEYFLNYEAMNNDFTICLGRKDAIRFH